MTTVSYVTSPVLTGTATGFDSDQESIDGDLPTFGLEPGGNVEAISQSSGVGIAALLEVECAERQESNKLQEIAQELQLFSLDECEETKLPFEDVPERFTEIQPPGIPFFTLAHNQHHHIYSQDSLVWPFEKKKEKDTFFNFSSSDIRKHIVEGYFERQFVSKKKLSLLLKYLFHLMCCTKDAALMHWTFKTVSYILDANDVNINFVDDLLLALANLGADISKLGRDVSSLSSPVIDPTKNTELKQEKPRGMFKENKILILKFLNMHLAKSRKYSSSALDELIKAVLAIAVDPVMLDNGISIYVSNGISRILNLYPSKEDFCKSMLTLVEHITIYCDFHHHTVSYICSNYILRTQKRGLILRSSLAYLQAEISLQRNGKDILEFVEVDDILDLVVERLHVFAEEEDNYLLHSVMTLLDFCLGDDPLQAGDRAQLQELCSTLEPVIKRRKAGIDDQHCQHLQNITSRLMVKWKQKAEQVKRQQTLMELKTSYSSGSQANFSSGLQAIQDNYANNQSEVF